MLPLVLPPIVGGVTLLTVVGRCTPIGSVAAGLGVPLTDSYAGVVLAQTFVAAPLPRRHRPRGLRRHRSATR